MHAESEFATIEEAWSIPAFSKPSPEQSAVQSMRKTRSLQTMDESAPSRTKTVHVKIEDPLVLDYLKVYRDEYRNGVVESLLRRAIGTMEGTSDVPWKPLVREVKNTLKEGFTTLCGTSDLKRAFQTVLLWVWFGIAILLFYLIARGGSN